MNSFDSNIYSVVFWKDLFFASVSLLSVSITLLAWVWLRIDKTIEKLRTKLAEEINESRKLQSSLDETRDDLKSFRDTILENVIASTTKVNDAVDDLKDFCMHRTKEQTKSRED